MAYKRKFRKRTNTRRRPYRKRYNRRNGVITKKGVGKSGIPDRMMVKMVYADVIRLSQAVTSFDIHTFRASDLFDPDFSGGGHQPRGYDQWASFYGKTMVHACKIKATFTSSRSDSSGNCNVYLMPSLQSGFVPDWIATQEGRYGKATVIGPYVGGNVRTLNGYMTTKRINGDINGLEQDQYGAVFGNTPIDNWYWHIGAETQDTSAINYVDVSVVLTYYVELFDRVTLPQS